MTALDLADLVVIAGRTLGIGADAALAQMDIAAARDALAEARPPGPATELIDRAAAAAAGVGLVRALLRHRPFPGHGQPVAVAAGLQFLSLNGWRADLSPAATAAVVVEALASGQLAPGDAAAWLSPRLTQVRQARRPRLRRVCRAVPIASRGSSRRSSAPRPVARVPARRAVAGAVLAVAVAGAALLSAACSSGPNAPATPSGGVSVCSSACGGTQPPP